MKKENFIKRLRPSLFWDADPKTLNPVKHANYIIERVLDFGTDKDIKILFKQYQPAKIAGIAKNSRTLRNKSKQYWIQICKKVK